MTDRGNISRLGFARLAGNPLYEYLIDLQLKRIHLLEALAPNRHLSWQLKTGIFIVVLWLLDLLITRPDVIGLPIVILVLLGPFLIFAGPFLAGWDAQMVALKNYPSPLDSPHALELLLSTPLSEREIVSGTLGAYLRYPFMEANLKRFLLMLSNILIIVLAVITAYFRRTLSLDIFFMALEIFLPTFCIFIFFPLLSGIDILLVPKSWLSRVADGMTDGMKRRSDRSGRVAGIFTACVMIPLLFIINSMGPFELSTLIWVITVACPFIISVVAAGSIALVLILPGYLAGVRRS